jgi:hypothetical protein
MTEADDRIAILEDELASWKEVKKRERDAILHSVKPQWEYTFTVDTRLGRMDRPYDDTFVWYRLERVMTNREEWEAVGNSSGGHSNQDGGYSYLVDTEAHDRRIIMSGGGGLLLIGSREAWSSRKENHDEEVAAHYDAITRLESFVKHFPNGGNVNHIVKAYQQRIGKDFDGQDA